MSEGRYVPGQGWTPWPWQYAQNIGAGTFTVPYLPNDIWYMFEGKPYRYQDGVWWNSRGERAWIPVHFALSQFANADALLGGYFAGLNQTTPLNVYPRAYNATTPLPIGQSAHHTTMSAIAVTAYQAENTLLEIHLMDQSYTSYYGNWDYGDSLLDPAWPPMVVLRHHQDEDVDRVSDPNSGAIQKSWLGNGVGYRSIPEFEWAVFDVKVRLDSDPVPHWVLQVYYANLATAGYNANLTWLCWLVGPALNVSNPTRATTFEYGTPGVAGHYKIWRPFEIAEPGPRNLERFSVGADQNDSFNVKALWHDWMYVAGAGTSGTIWFTDTGLITGNSLFKVTGTFIPPCVMVSASPAANTNHGVNPWDWKLSSQGMESEVDGIVTDSLATAPPNGISIQHPNTDEWTSRSWLLWNPPNNVFGVQFQNASGINNAAGSLRNSIARHYQIHAFGVEVNP